jgi:hypothetical protein
MLSNVPASALDYGKAVVQPVVAPVETGTSLANLASGAITKAASKVLPVPKERLQEEDVKTFDAVKQTLIGRYGSWDAFTSTLQSDPIGTLSDISTVLGIGAGALKMGGLSKTAKVANMASKITDPLSLPKLPIKAGSQILKKGAVSTMESALKIPPSIDRGKRLAAVEQALDLKVPLTERGATKIYDRISDLGDKMTTAITAAKGKDSGAG